MSDQEQTVREPCAGIEQVPGVIGGRPVIAGTRMDTAIVWDCVLAGLSIDEVIGPNMYPHLSRAQVEAALLFEIRQRHSRTGTPKPLYCGALNRYGAERNAKRRVGKPCRHRVRNPGERCHQHQGE